MKARGAVVGTLLVVLLLSALYPIRQYFSQKQELRALSAEEVRLADKIEELSELRSRLLTDAEIERIAREELGMVRPGEVAFVVVPDDAAGKAAATAPALKAVKPPPAGPSWFQRWWGAVVDSVTGMR